MSAVQFFNPVHTLGPNGIIVKNSHRTTSAYKFNYVWIIDNYAWHHQNKSELETPAFSADTNPKYRWSLTLCHYDGDDSMGLTISLLESSECDTAFFKCKWSILDEELKENYVFATKESIEIGAGDGFTQDKYILKSYLANPKLLPNGRLTIYCEIMFSETERCIDNLEKSNLDSIEVQPPLVQRCLSKDFGNLFKNQELTDVALSVNGKEYRAHKVVLAARSSVFAAMFKHNTKENENNLVEIIDIDDKVVEEMLHYIYTDKCQNLNHLANGLLAASNKYDLEGLKGMCQEFLINNLNVENAPETLNFADLHCAAELKLQTINFIVANSNRVTNSANWKKFTSSYSQPLMVELFEAMSRQVATT